jgi:N-acetylmuramic acid 6-phosphate etherase
VDSDQLILGVDGGASKTVAWLADRSSAAESGVVGRGAAGPSNPQAIGFDRALESLDRAIAAAFKDAGRPPTTVAAAVLGLAGSDRDQNRRVLNQWAEDRRLARHFRIVHDAVPVLAAGAPDGWGIALVSGTGSFAFGQTSDGRTCRSGGWGYLLGDEGSGYAIARAGLRAAAQASEGRGPATRLLEKFLARFQLKAPPDLIIAVSPLADDRAAIAALADVVFRAVDEGDDLAGEILDRAAADLTAMVHAVVRTLDMAPGFPLVLAGGVLLGNESLRRGLHRALATQGLHPGPTPCVTDPVLGALKLARDL